MQNNATNQTRVFRLQFLEDIIIITIITTCFIPKSEATSVFWFAIRFQSDKMNLETDGNNIVLDCSKIMP